MIAWVQSFINIVYKTEKKRLSLSHQIAERITIIVLPIYYRYIPWSLYRAWISSQKNRSLLQRDDQTIRHECY